MVVPWKNSWATPSWRCSACPGHTRTIRNGRSGPQSPCSAGWHRSVPGAGDLHIRIGIGTGEVIADPDASRTGEFMVTGETVNPAARLQQEAPPDAIVVDERTYAATTSTTRYQPLPAPGAGDFADKPRWLVLDFFDRPKPRGLHAPLVGRTDEVQVLLALYRRMAESRTHHLVTLIGGAGVGKTRLVEEVLDMLNRGETRPSALRGRCPAYGDRLAYWPLTEMLKQECQIVDSDSQEIAREKLDAGVRRVCAPVLGPQESGAIVATFRSLLGLEPAARRVSVPDPREAGDPRFSSVNLLQSLRAFLGAKADARPLILLFEDLHWERARTLFAEMGATFFVHDLDVRLRIAMPRGARPA